MKRSAEGGSVLHALATHVDKRLHVLETRLDERLPVVAARPPLAFTLDQQVKLQELAQQYLFRPEVSESALVLQVRQTMPPEVIDWTKGMVLDWNRETCLELAYLLYGRDNLEQVRLARVAEAKNYELTQDLFKAVRERDKALVEVTRLEAEQRKLQLSHQAAIGDLEKRRLDIADRDAQLKTLRGDLRASHWTMRDEMGERINAYFRDDVRDRMINDFIKHHNIHSSAAGDLRKIIREMLAYIRAITDGNPTAGPQGPQNGEGRGNGRT
jgi:hypothetical protein